MLGLVAAIWQPGLPPPDIGTAAGPLDDFSQLTPALDRYWIPRYAVRALEPLVFVAVAMGVIASERGRRALDALAGSQIRSPRRAGYVAAALLAFATLSTFPLHLTVRILRPGGAATDLVDIASWGAERLTGMAAVWGLVGLSAALITAVAPRWPRSWPWRLTILATAAFAMIAFLNPLIIDPLTVQRQPLPEGPTRAAIDGMLDRAGHEDIDVTLGSGRSASELGAYVTGAGATREIVISTDALRLFPPGSLAFVAAHELAHHEHHDVARGVLVTSAWLLLGLLAVRWIVQRRSIQRRIGASGPSDPRMMAAAVVFVLAVNVAASPLLNAVERRKELAADWRALQVTDDADAAVEIFRFLVTDADIHPDPPAWYGAFHAAHPEIVRRIRLAVAHEERQPGR